jgi:hypothetical protein
MRAILIKHIETAPREILGDFPRMTRDETIQVLFLSIVLCIVLFLMIFSPLGNRSIFQSKQKGKTAYYSFTV